MRGFLAVALVAFLAAGCIEVNVPAGRPVAEPTPAATNDHGQRPTTRTTSATQSMSHGPSAGASATTGMLGPAGPAPSPGPDVRTPHVTVATMDTGLNPFHPAWRSSRDPRLDLWGLPTDALNVTLQLGADFPADWSASAPAGLHPGDQPPGRLPGDAPHGHLRAGRPHADPRPHR
ncbi:MAG TPA: hypothetical protein VM327_09965 [Candidatus Thermoplasmatota archaeon]|nr:hypothetical protein [Candidatus Thermoplasmatota archaeon]